MARPRSHLLGNIRPQVEFTPERKLQVLAHMREHGSQVLAAESVGCAARTVREHLQKDKQFAEEYRQAHQHWVDNVLLAAAVERGVNGVSKPIIGGKNRDQIVTHVQEYSDSLLLAVLRANRVEFNKGAEDGAAPGSPGGSGGGGGGVLVVAQAPHSTEDWEKLFGEKSKGLTGAPE